MGLPFVRAGALSCAISAGLLARGGSLGGAALVEELLDAARLRVPSGASAPACALERGRPNFFLSWPLPVEQFGQLAYATVESVLFHHPGANVVLLSAGLPRTLFDVYLREGYCVVSLPVGPREAQGLAAAAAPESPGLGSLQDSSALHGQEGLPFLLHCASLALQVLHGGVSLYMDGLLLNPFDLMLPAQLSLPDTLVFLERLLPDDGPPFAEALQGADFDASWLPRSHTDRAEGYTVLCWEPVCPRAVPARSAVGQALLEVLVQGFVGRQQGSDPAIDVSAFATALYKLYLQHRPAGVPIQVEGFTFEHEIVLLPFWALQEPHFSDGWKSHGGQNDDITHHSQLFAPRANRESVDWSLVSSAKLWLPLSYGPPSARNILPQSVADLCLRRFTLGIMPQPYQAKSFGGPRRVKPDWTLRLPGDDQLGSTAETVPRNVALAGVVGGYRTFRQLRVVGKGPAGTGAAGATASRLRVVLAADTAAATFFCRPESRPTHGQNAARESPALRGCKAAVRAASSLAGGASSDPASPDAWRDVFDGCGTASELNAAVSLLAFSPVQGLSTRPLAAQRGPGGRLSGEKLRGHYGAIQVTLFPECSSSAALQSAELLALLDDVEDHITVVAHCAERCHLLDRLALSFRQVYERLAIIATCECSEEEHCETPAAKAHSRIENMQVFSVPYDFGLSRGKSFLARAVETEFLLVLDDDFVHSFHSCLECMLWRMRSLDHSLWRPFDILGFPVLEDERIFGAFRGQLRAASNHFFLEPMVEQITPDGCVRVDICPMVFLARTERFRMFEFQDKLTVGEHEQFFYANSYFGMQVGVCFDSSFPHFRVKTMSAGYVKRRENWPNLMRAAWERMNFERVMFMFRKYAYDSMEDYDELLGKGVPPWYISDDTCGQRPSPTVPFVQVFVVILSTGDAAGAQFRRALRGQATGAPSWLQQLASELPGNLKWLFAVALPSQPLVPIDIQEEQDTHRDVVVLPSGLRSSMALEDASFDQLLRLLTLLRDFEFRWLLVTRQDVFFNAELVLLTLQMHEPPRGKVLGSWGMLRDVQFWLSPEFFVLSRDVFKLFSAPEVSSRIGAVGEDASLGSLASLGGGFNALLRAFQVERVPVPAMHTSAAATHGCPRDVLALHPVSAGELSELGVLERFC